MRTLFSLFLFLFTNVTFSQNIEWQTTIGGSGSEFVFDVSLTSDGGYIVAGYSSSAISGNKTEPNYGQEDYWIVKLNSSGNILWQKTYGGSNRDYLNVVLETEDNGYLLGGRSNSPISGNKTVSNAGIYDVWLIKVDALGNIQWQNTYGGNSGEAINDIIYDQNGFILCATSDSDISGNKAEDSQGFRDFWILKIDTLGNIIWQNTIGGNDYDESKTICSTYDNSYLIGGFSKSNFSGDKSENGYGNEDCWLVKLDQNGNVLWDKTYGGDEDENIADIIKTNDGNYLLTNWTSSDSSFWITDTSKGSQDYWVLKINPDGDKLWSNLFGGQYSDYGSCSALTYDGGTVIGGYSNSAGQPGDVLGPTAGSTDGWLIKLNTQGDTIWQFLLNGSSTDWLRDMQRTPDGGLILALHSQSNISGNKTDNSFGQLDYWIVKLSCSGDDGIGLSEYHLDTIISNCVADTITTPFAQDECGQKFMGVPDISFPIPVPDTTVVTWTFTDGLETLQQEQIFIVTENIVFLDSNLSSHRAGRGQLLPQRPRAPSSDLVCAKR